MKEAFASKIRSQQYYIRDTFSDAFNLTASNNDNDAITMWQFWSMNRLDHNNVKLLFCALLDKWRGDYLATHKESMNIVHQIINTVA